MSDSSRFPYHELIGLEVATVANGQSVLRLVVDERHLRDSGIVHGGLFATLLDAGVGLAARTSSPAGARLVTAQLNLNFVRPCVPGDVLTVQGEVIHAGRTTVVARAEIRNQNDRLVAAGTGTLLALVPPPDAPA